MALLDEVKKATTNYSATISIADSTDGTPKTDVVFNSAGLDLWYRRPGTLHTSITEVTQTENGAHTDGGFVHISDGDYRLDLPDAALATGVEYVDIGGTVTGGVVYGGRIRLLDNTEGDLSTDIAALNDVSTTDLATALSNIGLDHLLDQAVVGTDVTDNSIFAKLVSSSATSDWDDFDNTAHSLQAIRVRGDAAWTTGGGGSITDIISWQPLIPPAIDLANTKSWRLGIATTNMLDDLPTALEITPGTISIDRTAQGGTTWSAIVTDAAMSESDGLIYYDEVFDVATGYAAGDVIRITMKGQLVTVSANDYVITPAGGQIYYTGIIADTPDVNIAQINGNTAAADALRLFSLAVNQGTGQLDSGSFTTGAITANVLQDGAFTNAKFADNFLTASKIGTDAIGSDELAASAVTEIQSGLATSAEITALNDVSTADVKAQVVAALDTDTYAELSAVPAATASIQDKLTWLYMLARNKMTQTSSSQVLRNDADTLDVGSAGVSDNGTTFTRNEFS